MTTTKDPNRPFPIQGSPTAPPGHIPWWLAEIAYASYSTALASAGAQSLERIAERGGFGWSELGNLLDGRYGGRRTANCTASIRKALENAWNQKPWETSK